MAYTADDLITDVERDSFQPGAQDHFTSAQKLAIADQEIHQTLAPMLVSLDAGYYLEASDTTLVASQGDYSLDRYAMWNKLRRLEIVMSGGGIRELARVDPDQRQEWDTSGTGTPEAFEIRHDIVVLLPAPSAADETLRQWIYRRPGRLVLQSAAAQVSTVNTGTGVVTYTGSKPATFTSSSVHDFYKGSSPFRRVGTAVTATASPGLTQQTFASGSLAALVASGLAAGDWVCVQDETIFPAIPIELHPYLKDLVIRSIARTHMDQAAYETQRTELVDRAKAAMLSGPGARIVGQPKKLSIPFHRVYGGRSKRRWF